MTARAQPSTGPDVTVGQLWDMHRWTRVGDISAYSIGTISCNIGDTPAQWQGQTNQHPVIAQNFYRLKNGRFEQIGMSWLKHGFAALADSDCMPCQNPNNDQLLGVGCSDPYNSGLNGSQDLLGPRSQVNAATGSFPFPFTAPAISTGIDRRLQVHDADLIPAANAGALYFVEGHYVTADDAAAGNDNNNASYLRISISETPPGSFVFAATTVGATAWKKPAIQAWQDIDAGVVIANVDVPGDGRLILAAKATNLGTGFYRYEYALANLNSDRSAGSFAVPIESHAPRRNVGFHDVDYHSGEPYDLTDWATSYVAGRFTWATVPYSTNVNANALRWATLYNFRLDTTSPPISNAQIVIGLFKPGSPTSMTVSILGPSAAAADCNNNGTPDWQEIQNNPALDCNNNGNLDACDFDCNQNGIPDDCEIASNPSKDCNNNGLLDVCEIAVGSPGPGPFFCVSNCQPDCNHNGKPDSCDIDSGFDPDCNGNGRPDSCDIALGVSADCDLNGVPDSCQIIANPAIDCNTNGIIDSCGEIDCNGNTIPDDCEEPACPGILAGDIDCNGVVNTSDLIPFVSYILIGKPTCRADMNHDGKVDGRDVSVFVHIVVP